MEQILDFNAQESDGDIGSTIPLGLPVTGGTVI